MWLLRGLQGELIYLTSKATITVSRTEGDIVLRGDKSVSRNHASVSVEFRDNDPKPLCIVKDLGSKYGSAIYRIEEKINVTTEGVYLQHMDKIKFGLQESIYTALYVPIIVLVSSLDETDIDHLQSIVNRLDGCIVHDWKQQTVTHLTTRKARLGEKVALALVNCIPIVNIQYWEAVQDAVASNRELPKVTDYILSIEENVIDKEQVSLTPNIDRRSLFKNLKFLFFSYSQFRIYKDIVKGAGGKALMFNPLDHTDLTELCSDEFVAVYYMIGSNQTEESILNSQTLKTRYEEIDELLRKRKRRMVSDSEILLAILHCSVRQHCNPKHNFKELLIVSEKRAVSNNNKKFTVLAVDTQDVDSKVPSNSSSENIIAETNEFTCQELGKSSTDETQSTSLDSHIESRPSSSGPSSIRSLSSESQENTGSIETSFPNLLIDQKRTEKRTQETFSFAPTKKLKLDSGSSLFPVLSKSRSQNSQSLQGSQRLQASQNLNVSQGSQRLQASQNLNVSQGSQGSQNVQHSQNVLSSQSSAKLIPQNFQRTQKNKSFEPSTSNKFGEETKSHLKTNVFGGWIEKSKEKEKEANIESSQKSETRNESNMQIEEIKKSQEKEKPVNKVWIRSDDSLLDEPRLEAKNKKERIEARIQLNSQGKRKESSLDESNIVFDQPALKKRRNEANIDLHEFRVSAERSDKRKRGSGDGDSDSNDVMMQKQQKRINFCDKITSDSSSTTIGGENQYYRFVTGLIREKFTDSLHEQTFGHKMFQKVYKTVPRARITIQTMTPYSPEMTIEI